MKNYGKTESTIKPEPITIDKYSVWICTDIKSVSYPDKEFEGFEYNMVQYTKEEFTKIQTEKELKIKANQDYLAMMTGVDLDE